MNQFSIVSRVEERQGETRVPKEKPSSNLTSRVQRLHKRLLPQFPDIDPHDLEMILTSLLRRPRERMQMMFLKKRKDGRYVF